MASPKTIAALVDKIALRTPSKLAIVSPFQTVDKFTYADLSKKSNALAGFLSLYGYEKNDILVSDLPNISENLILQLACNRLGVGYTTVKNIETMAKFPKVKGSVSATASGFLAETVLPFPYLSGEYLMDLIHNGGLDQYLREDFENDDETAAHGFFNTTTPYTNQQALKHGEEAFWKLPVTADDVVCVSVTLCHPFGLGTAVCSAFTAGATIALPAVGGIQGCGVPSERAKATLETLESQECTLLFADTHTLKALPEPPHNLKVRDGVCKIGSGSTFLDETVLFGGVKLRTMGTKEA